MPVNYDIHAKLSRCTNSFVDKSKYLVLISATAVSVAVSCIRIHRKSYKICTPVIPQSLKGFLIHIIREPCDSMGADTLKLIFVSIHVHYIRSFYRKFSMCFKWDLSRNICIVFLLSGSGFCIFPASACFIAVGLFRR